MCLIASSVLLCALLLSTCALVLRVINGYVNAIAARPPPAPANAWAMLSLCWAADVAGTASRGAVEAATVAAPAEVEFDGFDMVGCWFGFGNNCFGTQWVCDDQKQNLRICAREEEAVKCVIKIVKRSIL